MKQLNTLVSALSLTASFAFGQQLILQPNGTTGKDVLLGYHDGFGSANSNYPNEVRIQASCVPGSSGGINAVRAMMQFDLSAIPPNMTITSATLELFATGYVNSLLPGHFGNNATYLTAVGAAWTESVVTWNTEPALTANHVLVPESTDGEEDYTIDVTTLIEAMYLNPSANFGFDLRLVNEDPNDPAAVTFFSSDAASAAERPRLTVNYVPDNLAVQDFTEKDAHMLLYPNPAGELLSVKLPENVQAGTIEVSDENGRRCMPALQIEKGSSLVSIDVRMLEEGIYFVRYINDEKAVNQRFIKLK